MWKLIKEYEERPWIDTGKIDNFCNKIWTREDTRIWEDEKGYHKGPGIFYLNTNKDPNA